MANSQSLGHQCESSLGMQWMTWDPNNFSTSMTWKRASAPCFWYFLMLLCDLRHQKLVLRHLSNSLNGQNLQQFQPSYFTKRFAEGNYCMIPCSQYASFFQNFGKMVRRQIQVTHHSKNTTNFGTFMRLSFRYANLGSDITTELSLNLRTFGTASNYQLLKALFEGRITAN